jgi:plasmid stabilization system protein ParE
MVKWSRRARADLKAIHDRIGQDAPLNAKAVVHEILRKTATLADLPRLGRKVPELDDDNLREVPAHAWRILYQLRDGQVFIVTLIHKRRQLSGAEISARSKQRD